MAMTQLDILVHVREGDADPLAARTAAAIAQRVPAYLYGLGVAPLGSVAFTTPMAGSRPCARRFAPERPASAAT